jgi:hypothetical protein
MRLRVFIGFTILHLAVSAFAVLLGFAIAWSGFDRPVSPSAARLFAIIWQIFILPIVWVSNLRGFSAIGPVPLFIANSVIWGALVAVIWSWWQSRRSRTPSSPRPVGRRGTV